MHHLLIKAFCGGETHGEGGGGGRLEEGGWCGGWVGRCLNR